MVEWSLHFVSYDDHNNFSCTPFATSWSGHSSFNLFKINKGQSGHICILYQRALRYQRREFTPCVSRLAQSTFVDAFRAILFYWFGFFTAIYSILWNGKVERVPLFSSVHMCLWSHHENIWFSGLVLVKSVCRNVGQSLTTFPLGSQDILTIETLVSHL